jgi:predicted component of type VI protein secretion system
LKATTQKKTGKELDSQTRNKACAAPAIKSSTRKKPVLRNLNKIFNNSSFEETVLMREISVTTVMATVPSVRKKTVSSVVNLAWKKKCGSGAQSVTYGLTRFVLGGIAQKDFLGICV